MKKEKLKDVAKRFATQQFELYGEITSEARSEESDGGEQVEGVPMKEIPEDASFFARELAAINEKWTEAETLEEFRAMISDCRKCQLGSTRTELVFGTGNRNADIMVIGEAPGADEDRTGEPFVGRAGQLLTKILEAIDLSREEVYIANIIKSRPPGNRRPEREEVAACIPYLYKQIEMIKPRFILALGLTAAKSLLGVRQPMKELRGKVQDWHGIPVIITYHPAALLRNPGWKRPTWEDVQTLRRLYDQSRQE